MKVPSRSAWLDGFLLQGMWLVLMNFAARRADDLGPKFFLFFFIMRSHFFQKSGERRAAVFTQFFEAFVVHNCYPQNRCSSLTAVAKSRRRNARMDSPSQECPTENSRTSLGASSTERRLDYAAFSILVDGSFAASTSSFSIFGGSANNSAALAISAFATAPVRCASRPESSGNTSKMP